MLRVTYAHHNMVIVPDRVSFSILKSVPRNTSDVLYFSVEDRPQFQYHPFVDDFGPPTLPQLYLFARYMEKLLADHTGLVHFHCSPNEESKSNASLYITFFRMVHLNVSADDAASPIRLIAGALKPFRDPSRGQSIYDISVLDCLKAIEKALSLGWFDMTDFDPVNWGKMELIENGGMNWLIPGKLLAFASPYSMSSIGNGLKVATAEDVIPIFQILGINHVIRLNSQFYDASLFTNAGFKHTDLMFPDGGVPKPQIVNNFLEIMASEDVVAIHCKAGLGRTYFYFLISVERLPVVI
jgi:cell division cycle 14